MATVGAIHTTVVTTIRIITITDTQRRPTRPMWLQRRRPSQPRPQLRDLITAKRIII